MGKIRDRRIDFLKGFGIILVVLGHIQISDILKSWLYLFNMPLFLALSGCVYKENRNKTINEFVKEKARQLLWPYAVYGIFYIVFEGVFSIFSGEMNRQFIVKHVTAYIYGNYIWENNSDYIGVLWFLLALFCTTCMYKIVCTYVKAEKHRIMTCSTITIMGVFIDKICRKMSMRLPWCLDIAFVAIIFFAVGVELKKCKIADGLRAFWLGGLSICLGTAMGGLNIFYLYRKSCLVRVDMLTMEYGIALLFVFSAFFIIWGIWQLVSVLYQKSSNLYFSEIMEKIGRKSLLIMILHLKILKIIQCVIWKLNIKTVHWVILFMVDIIITYVTSAYITKYFSFTYKCPIKRKEEDSND